MTAPNAKQPEPLDCPYEPPPYRCLRCAREITPDNPPFDLEACGLFGCFGCAGRPSEVCEAEKAQAKA